MFVCVCVYHSSGIFACQEIVEHWNAAAEEGEIDRPQFSEIALKSLNYLFVIDHPNRDVDKEKRKKLGLILVLFFTG